MTGFFVTDAPRTTPRDQLAEEVERLRRRVAELEVLDQQRRQNGLTEQKRAEELLEKERRLLGDLLDLQERERRLFACEIHDGLAQQITGAQMRLQTMRSLCQTASSEIQQAYQEALGLLEEAICETRRLISGLRPAILDDSDLVAALEYLVHEARAREEPDIEFVHDVEQLRLAPLLETAVFRIVQESLNNACRHSHSPRIRVVLRSEEGGLHVEVQDWGVGFMPERVPADRFGLLGIRERVRLLDGRVSVETSPGKGTRIVVDVPNRADGPPPPHKQSRSGITGTTVPGS